MPCESQTTCLGHPPPGPSAVDWVHWLGSSTLGWRQKFGLSLGGGALAVFCEFSHMAVGFFLFFPFAVRMPE